MMQDFDFDREKALLLSLLKELSYERKRVILSSGRESDFYIDCRQTALHPQGAYLIGRVMYHLYRGLGIKIAGVGGPTLGADPLITAFSITSYLAGDPVPAFIIRKEPKKHGTKELIEGKKNLKPGAPVLIVEDVLTTGASALKAAEAAREEGFNPVHVMVLVDREEGGRENVVSAGFDVTPVFRRTDF